MTYIELLNNKNRDDRLYFCTFLTCNLDKMRKAKVTLVKNILGKYEVTKWLDYEYGRYTVRKVFSDRDLAADYAWKLFGECKD